MRRRLAKKIKDHPQCYSRGRWRCALRRLGYVLKEWSFRAVSIAVCGRVLTADDRMAITLRIPNEEQDGADP